MKVYSIIILLSQSFSSVCSLAATGLGNRREVLSQLSSSCLSSALALIIPPTPTAAVAASAQQEDTDDKRGPSAAAAAAAGTGYNNVETLRVPLHFVPSLSAYIIYYSVAGERFGAIIDTGSPFLMVPNYCNKQKWGCYRPDNSMASGLEPTLERFDNNQGWVEWRTAPFSFADASTSGSLIGPTLFTFGVLSDSLMAGPGEVFFGLIRDTDSWIRPSFLGQTKVQSFQVDLLSEAKSMALSTGPGELLLLRDKSSLGEADHTTGSDLRDNYIPLIRDLNRRFKDPACHYVAKALSIRVNGSRLLADRNNNKTIYVIFDTGVSGMVVTSDIFDERYAAARRNREKGLWGSVDIDLRTESGNVVTLTAHRPVTTPFGQKPWPNFKNAHLIVTGLAFLDDHKMTVDIDQQKLWIT
jgi:hypothetical protein